MTRATGRPWPKGSGGVRCSVCKAYAYADGKGTPITLKHKSDCPEHPLNLKKRTNP